MPKLATPLANFSTSKKFTQQTERKIWKTTADNYEWKTQQQKCLTLKSFPLRSTPLIKGRTPVAAISGLMSAAQPRNRLFWSSNSGDGSAVLFFWVSIAVDHKSWRRTSATYCLGIRLGAHDADTALQWLSATPTDVFTAHGSSFKGQDQGCDLYVFKQSSSFCHYRRVIETAQYTMSYKEPYLNFNFKSLAAYTFQNKPTHAATVCDGWRLFHNMLLFWGPTMRKRSPYYDASTSFLDPPSQLCRLKSLA